MSDSIEVVLVDDHPLVRAGLRLIIEQSERYSVVAEAEDATPVLALIEKHQPKLVLLDLGLPLHWQTDLVVPEIEKGGFALSNEAILNSYGGAIILATIRSRFPDVRVVVITQYEDVDIIASVIRAGADGFLLKVDTSEKILEIIDRVMRGETAQSERVMQLLSSATVKAGVEFTAREKEILELIANGFRDRDIAERLDISLRTVAFHKANLKEKIGAETLAELVAYYHGRVG